MSKYSESELGIDMGNENNSLTKIINLTPSGSKVLDFGCASGYLGEYLIKNKNCEVVGLEYDKEDAKRAEKRGYKKTIVCDLDNDKWEKEVEGGKYDVAIFADILEHLKYPEQVLEKTKKLLKKDGKILVSIPNIAHLSVRLELLNGSFEYEDMGILDNTHLKYWTRDSFLRMVNGVGLYASSIDFIEIRVSNSIIKKYTQDIEIKSSEFFKTPENIAFQWIFELESEFGVKVKKNKKMNKVLQERDQQIMEIDSLAKERLKDLKKFQKLAEERLAEIEKLQAISEEKDLVIESNKKLAEERLAEIEKLQAVLEEKDLVIESNKKLAKERLAEIEKLQAISEEKDLVIENLNKSFSEKFSDFLGKKSSKIDTFNTLVKNRGYSYAFRESLVYFTRPIFGKVQKLIPRWYEKDIMFISGCPGGSMQYRCYIEAEYYKKEGKTCEIFLQDNINIYYLLDNFKTIIFHRVIWTEHLQNVLEKAKKLNIEVIFSTDDLVYDPKYLKYMDYYDNMGKEEKSWYNNGISRELLEDPYCKKCIVTTDFLKKDLEKRGKVVEIRKNKLSAETIKNSKKAMKWWKRNKSKLKPTDEFWVGYFSGSASHDNDFKVIENVLLKFLKKHKEVVFFIGGYLNLDKKFDVFVKKNQVRWIPFVDWQKLPYEIVKMDLNIAPLEIENPFCQAKSDIKYLEAKAVGVPTIASATQPFIKSIVEEDKNKWGMVAYNEKDWEKGFEKYYKDRN